MIIIKIKEICAKLLLNISNIMITASTASFSSAGVEEMPESMKKLR